MSLAWNYQRRINTQTQTFQKAEFGWISEYKIKLTKSPPLMPKQTKSHSKSFHSQSTETNSSEYLRVSVIITYGDLFQYNFKMALTQAKQNMEQWSTPPLLLARRISFAKMVRREFWPCQVTCIIIGLLTLIN